MTWALLEFVSTRQMTNPSQKKKRRKLMHTKSKPYFDSDFKHQRKVWERNTGNRKQSVWVSQVMGCVNRKKDKYIHKQLLALSTHSKIILRSRLLVSFPPAVQRNVCKHNCWLLTGCRCGFVHDWSLSMDWTLYKEGLLANSNFVSQIFFGGVAGGKK